MMAPSLGKRASTAGGAYQQAVSFMAPGATGLPMERRSDRSTDELAENVDKKRVQCRAPSRLIDRIDALADILGEDQTDALVTAVRSTSRSRAA